MTADSLKAIMPYILSLRRFAVPSHSDSSYLLYQCLPTLHTLSHKLGNWKYPFRLHLDTFGLRHCWGTEQALCFLKKWATFDGRLAAVQEHTTKRLPAAFSALCEPMQQLGTICPHNGLSVTTQPNPVLAWKRSTIQPEVKFWIIIMSLQTPDIRISCFPLHSEHCS